MAPFFCGVITARRCRVPFGRKEGALPRGAGHPPGFRRVAPPPTWCAHQGFRPLEPPERPERPETPWIPSDGVRDGYIWVHVELKNGN